MKIEMWDIGKVKPYARNPRLNDDAVDAVAASLKEFGFRQPIVVDRKGVIIAGHTRYKAALKMGLKKVPVHVAADLTAEQVKAYRLADNRTADFAEWDFGKLTAELDGIGDELKAALSALDFDGLLAEAPVVPQDGLTDPDTVPEPPAEPVTKRGDLWILGNHRLLCGDSTKPEHVARLMNGEKAAMVWADPPFGISYTGHGSSVDGRSNKFQVTPGDDKVSPEWIPLAVPPEGSAIYLKTTWIVLSDWERELKKVCEVRSRITWDKCSHVAGDVVGGYAGQTEIVLFGTLGRHRIRQFDTDHWSVPRATTGSPTRRTGHPFESPVELPSRAIRNSSDVHDLVVDPFLGSGTTMIAAEQLGRRCFGCEIEPRYVQVALERYAAFTGKQPILESTGQTLEETGPCVRGNVTERQSRGGQGR